MLCGTTKKLFYNMAERFDLTVTTWILINQMQVLEIKDGLYDVFILLFMHAGPIIWRQKMGAFIQEKLENEIKQKKKKGKQPLLMLLHCAIEKVVTIFIVFNYILLIRSLKKASLFPTTLYLFISKVY